MVSSFCHVDLARRIPAKMQDDDRARLFLDFEQAKSYLVMGLKMKLDCWTRLPWCLAALGHWRKEERIAGARRALLQFDAGLEQGYDATMHHPLSRKLLTPGTQFRSHIEQRALDGTMAPSLNLEAARLKFMPVCERTLGTFAKP